MSSHELLSRGSGFITLTPKKALPIVLVSAHVAAPHRYSRYYPQEWLKHVEDGHVVAELDMKGDCVRLPLKDGYRHASLDVAGFMVEKKDWEGLKTLTLDSDELREGEEVAIAGYRVVGESGSGTEEVVETTICGVVREVKGDRLHVDTGLLSAEWGMCGGPVVLQQDEDTVVGMVEGTVAEGERTGESVVIGVKEISNFVADVEEEWIKQHPNLHQT